LRVTIADAYGNADGHIHSDGNGDSDRHIHAYRDSNSHRDSYSNGNCNGDAYSYGNCDRTAEAYAHATASADAAATSLVLSGIKGTRENQPASSQLQSCSKSLTKAARVLYKGGRPAS